MLSTTDELISNIDGCKRMQRSYRVEIYSLCLCFWKIGTSIQQHIAESFGYGRNVQIGHDVGGYCERVGGCDDRAGGRRRRARATLTDRGLIAAERPPVTVQSRPAPPPAAIPSMATSPKTLIGGVDRWRSSAVRGHISSIKMYPTHMCRRMRHL
ncbi:hypothetical protein EVAR_48731_1 [Eumeta japonica]|uniref:Uncharacterized protein n=1 Tax=Eumeta variegata TaxID=151549 RepID=A0A4C1YFA4_EUMVA|nr:hypothetical protein EVAR_48731_1 [Eumeta japonica]